MTKATLKATMLEAFRVRMYFFTSLVTLIFFILMIQLVRLQLVEGEDYILKSRSNMETHIPVPAARGKIYTRDFFSDMFSGEIAANRPSFNLTVVPSRFSSSAERDITIKRLARLSGFDHTEMLKSLDENNPWQRQVIKEDVPFDVIVKIASHGRYFPNIEWQDAPLRIYNDGPLFSHLMGYIGSISPAEYKSLQSKGYRRYHKIGKTGVEKTYDAYLRGSDGFIRRVSDVKNRTRHEEVGLLPSAGNNAVLNIDGALQKIAYDSLEGFTGAVIVLRPSTGEVLALVSKPDFDPNKFITIENSRVIDSLSSSGDRPFINRVIQSKYPPASTFKLVTAIAALETEKTYPSKTFFCPGRYTLKGYKDRDFFCYRHHGALDLVSALSESCSVYFYNLGYATGPTAILKYAEYFGMDGKSGIDLPDEVKSSIPSKQWKMKVFGQPWFDGDTINLSIGQGFVSVTPVSVALLTCGIVNGGIIYRPVVLSEIRSPDNEKIIKTYEKKILKEVPLSPNTLNTVRRGMRQSVISGTAFYLKRLRVPVAGKTGTAQTVSRRTEKYSQHAWFTGYAPYNSEPDKTVVVTVFVERGIAGAVSAVPAAEKIFSKLVEKGYF